MALLVERQGESATVRSSHRSGDAGTQAHGSGPRPPCRKNREFVQLGANWPVNVDENCAAEALFSSVEWEVLSRHDRDATRQSPAVVLDWC